MTALSGALPGTGSISTVSKKSRFWIRVRDRRNFAALKASPSTRRNSRRITSSCVRALPTMLMRSTNTRGPSLTSKTTSIVRLSRSRSRRGRTSTKAKPFSPTASVMESMVLSTWLASYQSPGSISTTLRRDSTSRLRMVVTTSTLPKRYRFPSWTLKVMKKFLRSRVSSATADCTRKSANPLRR